MIKEYFEKIIEKISVHPSIKSFRVLRQRFSDDEGYLRIRCVLINGDVAEMSEYVELHNGDISVETYSFHWQKSDGTLVKRWDNVEHHKELPTFPHHVHTPNGGTGESSSMNFIRVLEIFEREVRGPE